MSRRVWIGIGVIIAVLIGGGVYFGLTPGRSPGNTVNVAGNLPLTGPIAAFSGQYPKGFSMGIEDASKEIGIPKDKFNLDFQDNAGNPTQAVSVMQQQLLRKIDVYISGTSDMSSAVAPEVEKKEIPHVLIAFDAYLTHGGKNRLRIFPHYKIEGPIYVQYAKERKSKRVYIIALNLSSINEEFSKIVEPGLSEAGITYKVESYDFGTKEFRTIALKASDYKPDLIMVSGFSFHIYPILKALRAQGQIKDGSVLSTLDFTDLFHNDTPKSELSGVAFITPVWEIPGAVSEAENWRKRYQQQFGKQPSYVEAYAYDSGRIIVAAYKKSGVVNINSIRSVLPFEGITGTINLDQDGDLVATLSVAKVSENGAVERVWK